MAEIQEEEVINNNNNRGNRNGDAVPVVDNPVICFCRSLLSLCQRRAKLQRIRRLEEETGRLRRQLARANQEAAAARVNHLHQARAEVADLRNRNAGDTRELQNLRAERGHYQEQNSLLMMILVIAVAVVIVVLILLAMRP